MHYYTPTYTISQAASNIPACNTDSLKAVLLNQWKRITPRELEETGYIKSKIAFLIECKYGIHSRLTENYLSNIERTLPLHA